MAIRENKEAVKIDDHVNDIRGTLIGWKDATSETPPGYTEEAYRLVYSPHVDSNRSWLYKIGGWILKALHDTTGSTRGFEVSNTIYPRSGIEGFPNGTTVNGIEREEGTPDKRVVLKNNIDGESPYIDQVGPGSDGERVSDLKETINDLRMQLEAEETKSEELEEEVGRDSDDSRGRQRGGGYGPEQYDGYPPEDELGENYR